jgi:catechol 2,3-dioxygenase-like lactoylglutathione lyase family enzyme
MIDHLELHVSDLDRSTRFYARTLEPLGYRLFVPPPATSLGFGSAPDKLDFWLRSGRAAVPPPHFAFQCATRLEVARAYEAALAAGAAADRAPALLPSIHADYFAAFVLDPDGHKVEFVCHRQDAAPTA